MIDISKLNKCDVLAALYNHARPQGMGLMHFTSGDMSPAEAQEILDDGQTYFDYLHGRVMKVDLSKGSFDPYLYDRDNGHGVAEHIIDNLGRG